MSYRVEFRFSGGVVVEGMLEYTEGLDRLLECSPFTSVVELWGDEIYFELPVKMGLKGERKEMSVGEIAYWPDGNCLCIFFGRTPLSRDSNPVAYSDVKPLGKIVRGLENLRKVKTGEKVTFTITKP